MIERSKLTVSLDTAVDDADLAAHLAAWASDTDATTQSLRALREQVEAQARLLESPKGALEFLDFFTDFFQRSLADLRSAGEALTGNAREEHAGALRQIADAAATEQHRVVAFRDKWINKPLPYEQMRPLLTEVATKVRDQLADYHDLTLAASEIAGRLARDEASTSPSAPPPPSRDFDRRALFNRLLRSEGEGRDGKR